MVMNDKQQHHHHERVVRGTTTTMTTTLTTNRRRRSLRKDKDNDNNDNDSGDGNNGGILIPDDNYDVWLETLPPTKSQKEGKGDKDEDDDDDGGGDDDTSSPTASPVTDDNTVRISPAPSATPVPSSIGDGGGGGGGSDTTGPTFPPTTSSAAPTATPTSSPTTSTPTAAPTSAPTSTPTGTPTEIGDSSNNNSPSGGSPTTPAPSQSNQPTPLDTTATCPALVSDTDNLQVVDFRYWIDLLQSSPDDADAPTDSDRERTIQTLESDLLGQLSGVLLACQNADNAELGIVTLDYLPRDTLSQGQEECPPFLDHCFVYDGFMGLHISSDKDADAAIQATRETIESLMLDANNFDIPVLLEDLEYLGPPFSTTDAVERASPPTDTVQTNRGSDGLGAAGIFGIGVASFVAMAGMIVGLAYRRREDDDSVAAATNAATAVPPPAGEQYGTEPFEGAAAAPQSPFVSGVDVIADTGAP